MVVPEKNSYIVFEKIQNIKLNLILNLDNVLLIDYKYSLIHYLFYTKLWNIVILKFYYFFYFLFFFIYLLWYEQLGRKWMSSNSFNIPAISSWLLILCRRINWLTTSNTTLQRVIKLITLKPYPHLLKKTEKTKIIELKKNFVFIECLQTLNSNENER